MWPRTPLPAICYCRRMGMRHPARRTSRWRTCLPAANRNSAEGKYLLRTRFSSWLDLASQLLTSEFEPLYEIEFDAVRPRIAPLRPSPAGSFERVGGGDH